MTHGYSFLAMNKKAFVWAGITAFSTLGGCAVDSEWDGALNAEQENFEIVGGENADISEFPWQISMQTNSGFHFCGGSILDEEWILTASHCVDGASPSSIRIAAGITRKSTAGSQGQLRSTAEIVMFPGYIDPSLGKDVALLRVSSPFDLSDANVSAIEIVTTADESAGLTDPGTNSTVTGWGTLSSGGSTPDILQKVDVPIISNAQADAAYSTIDITDDMIAAGLLGVGGKDSCQGDSGGPLVVEDGGEFKLAGVVSFGFGCAEADFPGVYARVSAFEDFINNRGEGGGGGGDFPGIELEESNLRGNRGQFLQFRLDVPSGASRVTFEIADGSGDADLYVRIGSQPTTQRFDCRPFLNGNRETCTFNNPAPGAYFVGVRAFRNFRGVNLTGNIE